MSHFENQNSLDFDSIWEETPLEKIKFLFNEDLRDEEMYALIATLTKILEEGL
ncbi:MAG: hypothetical protein NZT61_00590 [Deltaproteobacteria bacterium]|nr:hypothetical protein [Deltaproteobacteria bacterium]MCX7952019.1 hypothetical protein [Deltaproteobacteria bacterium]